MLRRIVTSSKSKFSPIQQRNVSTTCFKSIRCTTQVEGISRRPLRVIEVAHNSKERQPISEASIDNKPNVFSSTMGELALGNTKKFIALEGVRLVEDALNAGMKMDKLFLLKSLKTISPQLDHFLELEKRKNSSNPEIHRVGLRIMESWSSTTTPPGIIGIFHKPKIEDIQVSITKDMSIPITVICDNIREPGNLGSILRSASGAGCDEIILSRGCVDPWNMKVLRGACGAHFRIPITDITETERMLNLLTRKSLLLSSPLEDYTATANNKSRLGLFICDNNIIDSRLDIPSTSYKDIEYSKYKHSFLVIGGETSGISDETIRLAKHLQNTNHVDIFRIRIPLANNLESLNAANAFGITVFEIARQFTSSTV